jgi:hypothetical protein
MNKDRRKEIDALITDLEAVKERVESILDAEREYFENMPESFQMGDKGNAAEEAVSELEYAVGAFDEITANLENARG